MRTTYFSIGWIQTKTTSLVSLFMTLVLLIGSSLVFAEDEDGEGEEAVSGTSYIQVEPAFVTNYGGTTRLRYVKVDVTLKVDNNGGADQVAHHMPVIKDKILTLLSQQSSEAINSFEGKESIRSTALAQIAELLQQEDGESYVKEVLFTSFVAHTL